MTKKNDRRPTTADGRECGVRRQMTADRRLPGVWGETTADRSITSGKPMATGDRRPKTDGVGEGGVKVSVFPNVSEASSVSGSRSRDASGTLNDRRSMVYIGSVFPNGSKVSSCFKIPKQGCFGYIK